MAAPKAQIGPIQAVMLVTNIILPTTILFLPAFTAAEAREGAWIAGLVGTAGGMLLTLIHSALAVRFPGQNLLQFLPRLMGTPLGKIIGFTYLVWLLHLTAFVMREFGAFFLMTTMPDTPDSVIYVVMMLLCAFAVRHGIEVLARVNQVIFFLILVSLFLVAVLLASKMEATNLLPLPGADFPSLLRGAYSPLSWMGEAVIAMIVAFPYLSQPQKARPIALSGVFIAGLVSSFATLLTIAAVGVHWIVTAQLPVFAVTRYIEVGGFLERMEPVFIITWVGGVFIKASIIFYGLCKGTADWLGLGDFRPLVLPFVTVIIPVAFLIARNTAELGLFAAKVWPPYAILLFEFGLPLLIWLVALLRPSRCG